ITSRFLSSVLIALAGAAALPAASADYSVVARFPVPGDFGGYDYLRVDGEAHRLYVTHEKRVEVLDSETGKKVGEVGPTTRAHGVGLAPKSGHGFATSG